MSGHSKWANTKHRKGAQDAKRGKMFTKLAKEIAVAARMGGGDPEANPRLRAGIVSARAVKMPKYNLARAIKNGIGGLEGVNYEEITYEGYGPGGVAVLVDCLTDNRNRTVGEVRFFFGKSGGNLGETGCVSYMFDKKGSILVEKGAIDEEKLLELALEAGAEDMIDDGEIFQVVTAIEEFNAVREALEKAGVAFVEASLTMIPKNTIEVAEEKTAISLMKLIDNLEDFDDVQKVHANFDIPDELMEKIS